MTNRKKVFSYYIVFIDQKTMLKGLAFFRFFIRFHIHQKFRTLLISPQSSQRKAMQILSV